LNIIPKFLVKKLQYPDRLRKIFENLAWLFADKILRLSAGLLIGVWIARYFGPEQFGLFSYAMSFLGLFGAIAGLGLQGIVVRNIVCDPESSNVTLGTAAILQFIAGFFAYGLMLITIFWLRPTDTYAKILISILGLTFFFKFSDVAIFWFESQIESKYTVWVQNFCFILFVAIKIWLILIHSSIVAFAWATVAEGLAVALLMVYALHLRDSKLSKIYFSFECAKMLLKDSWPMLLSALSIGVYMKIDQIMLGQMLGNEAVGIFTAATRISEAWYFIPMMIVSTVFPSMLEIKNNNEIQFDRRMQNLYDLMALISIGVAIPMTLLSTPLVVILYGDSFAPSGLILAIHIWAGVFVSLGVASGQWLLAQNIQILLFYRTLIGAFINIIMNIILIPKYGVLGAAISTVISQLFVGLLLDVFRNETRKIGLMKIKAFNLFRIYRFVKG